MQILLTRQVLESLERLGFKYFLLPASSEINWEFDDSILIIPIREDQIREIPLEKTAQVVPSQSEVIDKMIKGRNHPCFVDEDDFK